MINSNYYNFGSSGLCDEVNDHDEYRNWWTLIRRMPEISTSSYSYRDGLMFTLDCLIELCIKTGLNYKDNLDDLRPRISLLKSKSWIDAKEAFIRYPLTPLGYTVRGLPNGKMAVQHIYFRADVPGVFDTRDQLADCFVKLLNGEIIPCLDSNPDFVFNGQPYINRELCRLSDIKFDPDAYGLFDTTNVHHSDLNVSEYTAGYVSTQEYIEVVVSCSLVKSRIKEVSDFVKNSESLAFELYRDVDFSFVNESCESPVFFNYSETSVLRSLYPMLSCVADEVLGSAWAEFSRGGTEFNSTSHLRQSEFLHYLAGLQVCNSEEIYEQSLIGKLFFFALSSGLDQSRSLGFASSFYGFMCQIENAKARQYSAMNFIRNFNPVSIRDGYKASQNLMDVNCN